VNPLKYLEDPLRWLLDHLHQNVHLTYGWSIVVLTVIVRLVLLPLVIAQYRSMRRMAAVAPQIKELQAKYKGNRQKQQEELMRFYRENQINPFASCLPLVAQLPVFFALYYVLKDFSRHAQGSDLSFMWVIPDISKHLNQIGWGAIVIVAIYGLSQLLSTELSATPNMSPTQRRIMRFLPIIIVGFVFTYPVPAGLVLYWMTTNLWTCGQQLVMRRMVGHHPALAPPGSQPAPAPARTAPEPAAAVAPATPERRPPRRRRRAPAPAAAAAEDPEANGQVPAESIGPPGVEPVGDSGASQEGVPDAAPTDEATPQEAAAADGAGEVAPARSQGPQGSQGNGRPAGGSGSRQQRPRQGGGQRRKSRQRGGSGRRRPPKKR
jgi:YidC/Oxa1 family membrane protein insertase